MMLMRNCVVLFGYTQGVIAVVLMWLPTELMTRLVTPHVLAQLSLAYAIGVRNKSVLDEMMEDATAEGDYAAAGQVTLTLTRTPTLKPYTVTVTAHHSPLTFHPSPQPSPSSSPSPGARDGADARADQGGDRGRGDRARQGQGPAQARRDE
eukprot:scaffold16089_cov54-Phaeocystis_antarctica.AAC.4